MTTAQLMIICATVLGAVALAARSGLAWSRMRAQFQRESAMHERAAAKPVDELATATAALAAATDALELHARDRGPSRVGHRVTVHTKQPDDQTIFGVVVGDYTDRIALEDAEYVVARGDNQVLPGRQDIATSDIAWIDVHAHVAAAPLPSEA